VKTPTLEEKIAICEDYTQQWGKFFNFFGDGFEGRKVTGETEAEFFRVMTDLARKEFRLIYFMEADFKSGDQITEILRSAVSLSNIQGMSEAQFSKFQYEWHVVFIALNKCLGRLIQQRPVPKAARAVAAKQPQSGPPPSM